jgi:hypothetical protein
MPPGKGSPHNVRQIPIVPEHSRLYPENLLVLAVYGLAHLESWRKRSAQFASASFDDLIEMIADADARRQVHVSASKEFSKLEDEAEVDPRLYPTLWTRQECYHQNRAHAYGESILESDKYPSFFSGIRRAVLSARQSSHLRKAGRAAAKLGK